MIEKEEDRSWTYGDNESGTKFDQMMAGLSHFDNESLASLLSHVQTYSEQQNAFAQEACCDVLRVNLVLVGLETSPTI